MNEKSEAQRGREVSPQTLKPKSRLVALCFALGEASRQSMNNPYWSITVAGGIASIREVTSLVPCDSVFWDEGEYISMREPLGKKFHI